MDKPRVLIVEDDRNLATGLKLNFELEGYTVDVAALRGSVVGAQRKPSDCPMNGTPTGRAPLAYQRW